MARDAEKVSTSGIVSLPELQAKLCREQWLADESFWLPSGLSCFYVDDVVHAAAREQC
jgi:hypothetical protein